MNKTVLPSAALVLGLTGGLLIGRATNGTAGDSQPAAVADSRGDHREPRSGERLIPTGASLADLRELMKTGSSRITGARITLALEDVPKEQLANLAGEMREYFRTHPGYDNDQSELLNKVMGAWADADLEGALSFTRDSPSKAFRTMAQASIFGVLAEDNPEDAVARAKELPTSAERTQALASAAWAASRKDPREAMRAFGDLKELPNYLRMSLFEELARVSPEEAVAALGKVSPARRDSFWNSDGVFTVWAAENPEAVVTWAQSATDLDMKNSAIRAACRRMASDDPAATLEKIGSMPAHLRSQLIAGVMESWADRDLTGALAAANAMGKPAEREEAMAAIVQQLDWMDPQSASKVVLSMPKGNARRSALENLGESLHWQSPAVAAELLAQFEGVEHSQLAGIAAWSILAEDPQAAIKLFSSIPATERGEHDLQRFSYMLSRHDPAMALEFAATLGPSERSQVVRQAIEQMAYLSPQDAVKRMDALSDPKDRQQALVALAETWGKNDSEAALRWAASLSGDEQTTALAKLLPQQARNDPAGASARLQSLLENPGNASGSALQSATGELASEWAGRNPLQAAAWVAGLPAGAAAESGATSLIGNWSSHDPAGAANWISTLPDGGVKDAAIQPLVQAMRQSDPETAFSWGLSVQDPAKRASIMEETIRLWNTNDADAVRLAIRNAELDDTERATYEKLLR